MSRSALTAVIRQAADPGDPDPVLLERFRAAGDHAAFAELVRRYARLVWGQCRHLSANEADVEDAFQATFLALARHAGRVRDPNRLGPWLHTVAGRVCRTARRAAARRAKRERAAAVHDRSRPVADSAWDAAAAVVHDEVNKLPESLRVAFVLCVLEGKTPTAAAGQLGVPVGTVGSHVHRAKQRLLERLAARGIGAAVAFATLCDATPTASAMTRALEPTSASSTVLSLLPGAVPMTVSPAKLLLVFGLLAVGASAMLLPTAAQDKPKAEPPNAEKAQKVKLDLHGDPLPDKAVMRLGTVKYRLDDIAGVGFKKSGELVALTNRMEVFTYPADGGAKPTVSRLREGRPVSGAFGFGFAQNARYVLSGPEWDESEKTYVYRVLDVAGGKPSVHLTHHFRSAHRWAFSPDGKWLAVQSDHRVDPANVVLADLTTKKWKVLPVKGIEFAEQLAFAADGKRLALIHSGTVMVFDTDTTELLLNASIPGERLGAVALSPEGKTVAVLPGSWLYGGDKEVRLLNVADGAEVNGVNLPKTTARSLGFLPDGKTLWFRDSRRLREWDLAAGKWLRETAVPEYSGSVATPPVWSPDGTRFVAHNHHTISLHDAKTWKPLNAEPLAAGPTDAMHGITLSPDGNTVVTDGYAATHLWDAATGKLLGSVKTSWGYHPGLVFLPDSKTFFVVSEWQHLIECDTRTGKELRRFKLPDDLKDKVSLGRLRLSADGKTLEASAEAARSDWLSFRLKWDVAKGEVSGRSAGEEWASDSEKDLMDSASPDGEWGVVTGTLRRTDGMQKPVVLFPPAEAMFPAVAWSADSKRVALSRAMGQTYQERQKEENGRVVVFDVGRNEKVRELAAGLTRAAAFSPDGKRLATAGGTGIAVWDLATGKDMFRTTHQADRVYGRGIAFTPDGKRLITAHGTHALVWDVGGK